MMMSNPPSSLQSRQKLHRRQNSTPVAAFEAMKVQMPPTQTHRHNMHRRGQSFDLSRGPIRRHAHNGSAISMHTNIGPIHGQQILREAQQQRIPRPGQQAIQPRVDTSSAQQCGMYTQPSPSIPYDMTMNTPSPNSMMQYAHMQNAQMPMSAGFPNPYMFDENNHHYFQAMHQMQDIPEMMPFNDRRMSQPDLRIQTGLRPYTPIHQIQTAHFPLTPAQTPAQQHARQVKSLQASPRAQQQDETIVSPRPVSMQKSRSLQGIAEHDILESFDLAPAIDGAESAIEPVKTDAKTLPTNNNAVESHTLFGEVPQHLSNIDDIPLEKPPSSPTRPALSPRRISISDLHLDPGISASSVETNVSLDDIAQYIEQPDPNTNKWRCVYEGCNREFGRKENIKSHIQTHLGDRQFRCNHCNKDFVRGHDLKRHSKIHTGTKAYTCMCGNAFARHDALTRHRQRGMCVGAFEGVIRKEVKRGRPKKHRPDMEDRLDKASRTRSRKQRSMQTSSNHDAYNSSASSCSMSSWGSPPIETMDNLSIHGDAHSPNAAYDGTMNILDFHSQGLDMHTNGGFDPVEQIALHPGMFSFTPPASPGYSTGNKPSPSYRGHSPADLPSFDQHSQMASNPGQPMDEHLVNSDVASPHHMHIQVDDFSLPADQTSQDMHVTESQPASLPALSHSSSPPPPEPSSAYAYDFSDEFNPLRMSTMSNMSFGLSAVGKAIENSTPVAVADATQRNDFDSFLDFNDDSQLGMNMSMDNTDAFFASI